MAIRYIGTDIIRDYRGWEIRKTTTKWLEDIYIVEGWSFNTLREAKKYIDEEMRIFYNDIPNRPNECKPVFLTKEEVEKVLKGE